tara:strand:- start:699 stop:1427 length:729 start_codon:yes stop_codon:yes gene_type:complete
MIGILLMSGKGKRFSDAGYSLPKPLIPVLGYPMFIKSLQSFPKLDKWFFVISEDTLNNEVFVKSVKKFQFNYELISLKKTSQGQAESCYLAVKKIEKDTPFFVGPCDLELLNEIDLNTLFLNNEEIVILSYNPKEVNFKSPEHYGWIEDNETFDVEKIEIKTIKTIDKANSKIISGAFIFRNKDIFLKYYQAMVLKKIRVNNEYYIDTLCSVALNAGSKIVSLNMSEVKSYGTPEELRTLNE